MDGKERWWASDTLTVERAGSEPSALRIIREGGGMVRVEVTEVVPLVEALVKAWGGLLAPDDELIQKKWERVLAHMIQQNWEWRQG
jgi:hypothetical protein